MPRRSYSGMGEINGMKLCWQIYLTNRNDKIGELHGFYRYNQKRQEAVCGSVPGS